MQSTHKDWRGKRPVCTSRHTERHIHICVSVKHAATNGGKKKRYCWFNFQVSSFSFFLCCFSCLFLFLPPDYFYICYSCLFPSPPPLLSFPSLCLITLVLSFRVGLLQSWCAAYFCVTSRTHHTHATRTLENTLINTVSTAAHML